MIDFWKSSTSSRSSVQLRAHRVRAIVKFGALLLLVFVCLVLNGCRNYFLAYPYPWDHPKKMPQKSDIVGTYKITQFRLPSTTSGFDHEARIELRADGSAALYDIPEFDLFGEKFVCNVTGVAKWNVDGDSWGWSVLFRDYQPENANFRKECDFRNSIFGNLQILGRYTPYRLYMYVGDPDSDTGIEFGRAEGR